MQRKSRYGAWILVANASLWMMACATAVMPDLSGPMPEGSAPIGSGGSGGALASAGAGDDTNGGNTGASVAGTASGGSGQGSGPGSSGGTGGKSANGGGGTAGVGKGGTGSGGTGSGGKGSGKGGASSATGGSATGGSATGGSATGGSGTSGGPGSGGTGGGSVNLITNSGFETNTSGWSVFGGSATIATTTAQSHSGTQSLVITGRTQPYQGPQYSVLSLATPGTSYRLSVWGRLASSNPTGSLTVTLHYTCSGGSSAGENYFTWVATSAASATSWTQFSSAQTFPACAGGGTMSVAQIYVESPTATLSYYVDDVVFTTP